MNVDDSNEIRLTINNSIDNLPSWFPDKSKIFFQSTRDGNLEVYKMNIDGTKQINLSKEPHRDDEYSFVSLYGSKYVFI